MRRRLFKPTVLLLALLPLTATAQIRYAAPIDETAGTLWSNSDSKLVCMLIHDIPQFGHVDFVTYAGRDIQTSMQVVPKLTVSSDAEMRFISAKPEWQSGGREYLLGRIKLYAGFNPYVGPTIAWKVLSELGNGKQIFMPYTNSLLGMGQLVVPSLSPLGFKGPYNRYINCQHQLLRVNFNDVRMLPLVFRFQSTELTGRSLDRLKQQIDYIKEDKAVNKIVIKAYSYDMRRRDENIRMARDRGEALMKFYTEAGYKEEQIEIVPFNALTLPDDSQRGPLTEEDPSARNALVTLSRDSSLINRDLEAKTPDVGADSAAD